MTRAMQTWKELPEGVRAEVIDNALYVHESPTTYHQQAILDLTLTLANYVNINKLGRVLVGPVDVFFNRNKNVFVPDLVFVSKRNKNCCIEKKGIYGPPDLVIEILSSNRRHDLVIKKSFYEGNGIREYWLVDPETREATGYLLKAGSYGKPLLLNSEINIRILNKSIKF
jgi:Uma2 family endonuclease